MNYRPQLGLVLLIAIGGLSGVSVGQRQEAKPATRNPFGIPDVPNPVSEAAKQLADAVNLTGDGDDPNAADWTDEPTIGNPMFLDGDWYGRWHSGSDDWNHGTAKIRSNNGRIFILYKERDSEVSYLIEAVKMEDNRLVGSYVTVNHDAPSPWVGLIVDGQRIDGIWSHARWDFRRQAKFKSPAKPRPN